MISLFIEALAFIVIVGLAAYVVLTAADWLDRHHH